MKLVFFILKNAMVTGGARELKCNSHTVKKMTKVPQGFDFSFLNDEEARKILQVLERNEELRRAEKDRISKLQKTKRDIRWLQGVTGEWFEEIQRKKFCNETDVSQMLKQPLTYRLRKEMAKNELETSRSKNLTNQKKPTSVPSRLSFRSSLASLFSFRKSGKETSKLQSQGQKGWDSGVGSPVSVGRAAGQAKIYSSPLENQPVNSAFAPRPAVMREESGMPPPWDAPLLENEFFQVLDDLDSKLAQEQAASTVNTRTPFNYGSRAQFSDFYSTGNRHGNITGRHKNHYNETSNMSIYDILRPRTPREGFKTFSPRTRTIYDMYRTREPRILKEDYVQKNTFGSTSLCFDSRQRSAFPARGRFTTKSLHFPSTTQSKSGFVPPRHQQSPKRTPLSSIIWNRVDSSRDRQNQEECGAAPSPMEIDPADQYRYPRCLQENKRYELYHSQNVYQGAGLNARMDNAMSADTFENSENMPFYRQDNPFARSFFRNTFGRGREQRFGQSPFGGHREEHSSWSDIHHRRKSFTSDGDFEMISIEADSASACHGHSVSSEHWESFSSGYGTNVSRGQEKPHPWQFDFQASSMESMELSQDNRGQVTPHFGTPNVCSMTSSSYHIRSGGLEYQQGSSPVEVHMNKETPSFGIAQTTASTFKSSFPHIPDGKGNPPSSNFQNPTVTLQKIIPDKPATYQRSPTEVTITKRHSVDSSPLAESQPDILVTEVNNEKELNGSIPEDDRQLSTMDQTNMPGFSRRSPLHKDPSLGEREERENSRKNQNNQFAVNPSESQQSHDSHVAARDEEVAGKGPSHSPFRSGKGKGKVRRRISCIEKLSKTESTAIPASDSSSLTEVNQGNSRASKLDTIYCTLPRQSTSFLINSRQSGSQILAASFRNGPPPFQVKNNVEDPRAKGASNRFSPSSPESVSECSKDTSDSAPVVPEVTARMKSMKITGSASVRKGPLPFFLNRATARPLQKPSASTGRDEGEKSPVSDTDAPALTPRPRERIVSPVQSDLHVGRCSLTQRHHQTERSQESTEEDGKIAASRTSAFALPNEDPLPVCSEFSGKESGKTLHQFKTTSMFSVSGDEDNVKCLEVVSIYYTLPRKPSKKFCDLLQRYTQNTDSHIESPHVETETLPNALEEDNLNYSTQEQSRTPPPESLQKPVTSAQKNTHCLSFTTENRTILQSPIRGPSEPTLQEMVPDEEDISVYKNESKTREIFPDNLAKTPLGISRSRREKGKKLMLPEKNITEEKSENCQPSINSGNSGPSSLLAHSEDNVENSHTRSSGKHAGCGIDIISLRNGRSPQKDHMGRAVADSSNRVQPREDREEIGANCQKMSNETPSDSESQVFALMPALQNLQLVEEAQSGEPDSEGSQSEARELPQRSQEVKTTDSREATEEMQKFFSDDLEKEENRYSVNHRFSAISKASRKFPAKDLSPRRHVATIFPQTGNTSGFGHLSLGTPECSPLSPEPTPKSAEATGQSRLSDDGVKVRSSENPLQVTVMPNREPSPLFSSQKPSSISQVCQNEFRNTSESPPKREDSKAVTVTQSLEKESGAPAQLTFTSPREADFSDHQRRLSPPFPLEPKQKPRMSLPVASSQQQQRSASTLEWESESHLYRSKSLKSINVHGDQLRKSLPPKGRERHFSESISTDNALTRLTLRNEFSVNNGYSRRFKSFSELPTCDEKESWAVYSCRTKAGPRSATSISRPIDYGIFGKEQQLAFLENVKRSLTQGRLWKPSFLKNPGFLKDDVISPSNASESLSSNSIGGPMPEGGLSPSEPLNIYEDDPVDSDCDTDTTTDDEYYLDEKDKESELDKGIFIRTSCYIFSGAQETHV
ncbi:exophilin-5 isoform X1 [Otolemur garnettii]|uniref:exophilin-5 isoform X1 n=3 Tax=Otolemur garnettii TaxID=30611 RepID=UPI000C7F17A1|nr:exophilin-5 isoform X1 [Otolemur garnettii]